MRKKLKRRKANRAKSKLGLPDLEQAKSAVLASLRSPESQRSYRRIIEDFVYCYRSEPRLSFNNAAVTRYRIHLEEKLLAPGTINVRLAEFDVWPTRSCSRPTDWKASSSTATIRTLLRG